MWKISKLAQSKGYELRVIGVPKTIDNDLVTTDHCPGYGSVVKYLCTVVKESALDHEAMGQHDLVSIIEVMGRNAGWIAAGATLAKSKENPNDAPHLIYLPELPFSKENFIEDVQSVLKKNKYCMVIVGEGLVDKDGNYVANSATGQDAFGHQQLGGVGDFLANLVEQNLAVKARSSKLGIGQRFQKTFKNLGAPRRQAGSFFIGGHDRYTARSLPPVPNLQRGGANMGTTPPDQGTPDLFLF